MLLFVLKNTGRKVLSCSAMESIVVTLLTLSLGVVWGTVKHSPVTCLLDLSLDLSLLQHSDFHLITLHVLEDYTAAADDEA